MSVVIPVHNRAGRIETALASVRAQTHRNLEIIVVDDASTDDTVRVIESLSYAADVRLVMLTRNSGACAARNVGLEVARGDYVAFLDSDDAWEPSFIETLLGLLEQAGPDTGFAAASYRTRFADGRTRSHHIQQAHGQIHDLLLRKLHVVGVTSCVLFRTATIRTVGGFDRRYPAFQDCELFIRLSRTTRFASTKEILFTHFDWDDPVRISLDPRKRLKALMMLYRDHLKARLKRDHNARAAFASYLADQMMRLGRHRKALRLFLFCLWAARGEVKTPPLFVLALLGASPQTYGRAVIALTRLHYLLSRGLALRPVAHISAAIRS